MPKYQPNLRNATTQFFVAPDGTYTCVLKKPKAFFNSNVGKFDENGVPKKDNWGIRITPVIESDDEKLNGKALSSHNLWFHTEKTENNNLEFSMCALGFTPRNLDHENTVKNMMDEQGIEFDTETGAVGQFWANLEGKKIKIVVETEMVSQGARKGQPQNKFTKFMPFGD